MRIQNKNPISILPNVRIKERGLRMTNIEAARALDNLVKQVFEEDGFIGNVTARDVLAIRKAAKALRKLQSMKERNQNEH